MASTASSFLSPIHGWVAKPSGGRRRRRPSSVMAQQPQQQQQQQQQQQLELEQEQEARIPPPQSEAGEAAPMKESLPRQPLATSKNMSREYGGQWLSSATRHIRIYAAYIDPVTHAFDQTQMDKLTLILDPTDEFAWSPETCQMVYSYFQELVDHYEGAPLTEYTLRLIGSDLEHYLQKLLYEGVIKYNMNARVLNFSMGKPRLKFNTSQIPNVE